MDKFKNKYRIKSSRAPFWDYRWNAHYFVTISTRNRICWFGNVVDGENILSRIGDIACECWLQIPIHFPFVKLGAFVVMPNHIHGIINIDKNIDQRNVETQNLASLPELSKPSPQLESPHTKNNFGPQSRNLASIVRGFKIGVTKRARSIDPDFSWQPRYYDHIIRNEKSYQNITKYIVNNPGQWTEDE